MHMAGLLRTSAMVAMHVAASLLQGSAAAADTGAALGPQAQDSGIFVDYAGAAGHLPRRALLHGCHGRTGRKGCAGNLPRCPRCQFPRTARSGRSPVGHCRAERKVLNCRPQSGGGTRAFRVASAGDVHRDYEDAVADYSDLGPVLQLVVAYDDLEYTGYTYDYAYDDEGDRIPESADLANRDEAEPAENPANRDGADTAADPETQEGPVMAADPEDLDRADPASQAEMGTAMGSANVAVVTTAEAFQEALEEGVQHIVLTAHLDMRDVPSLPDVDGVEALNNAVGRVQPSTASIVGQCDGPAPAEFGLTEPRPEGACAVLVREDFLDIPLGTGPQGGGLLLDRLYVAVAAPAGPGSSVLLLHVDGQVWITNSVFQGAGRNCRAIDVSTADGGDPKLYVQGTTFVGFTRNLAPGVRVNRGATAVLDGVVFRDMELLEKTRGTVIEASAVAAYQDATLGLIGVTFEDNIVNGSPAQNQAVAVAKGSQRTAYAEPRLRVWQWPGGPTTRTRPQGATSQFLEATVAPVAAALRSAQQERQAAVSANNGR